MKISKWCSQSWQTYKQNSSDTYHFEVVDSENAHQGNSFFLFRMHSLWLLIHKQDLRFETLSVLLLLMMIMMKNMFVDGQFVCYNEPSCFSVQAAYRKFRLFTSLRWWVNIKSGFRCGQYWTLFNANPDKKKVRNHRLKWIVELDYFEGNI